MVLFSPPFYFVFDISNLLSHIQNNFKLWARSPCNGNHFSSDIGQGVITAQTCYKIILFPQYVFYYFPLLSIQLLGVTLSIPLEQLNFGSFLVNFFFVFFLCLFFIAFFVSSTFQFFFSMMEGQICTYLSRGLEVRLLHFMGHILANLILI